MPCHQSMESPILHLRRLPRATDTAITARCREPSPERHLQRRYHKLPGSTPLHWQVSGNQETALGASGQHGGHGAGAFLPLSGTSQGFQSRGEKPHGFQEVALGLRAYRQQLIASNIANADTPGYKAVDIDLGDALRIAQSATPPTALATTSVGHIAAQVSPLIPAYSLKYHAPNQASVDGNTVEMDVERAKFAENALQYQFSMDRVSGHFKMMIELFQNLK